MQNQETPIALFLLLALLFAANTQEVPAMSDSLNHPLMPGVRCAEINNPDWPRTLHDKQLTGFSPLTCGMAEAPEVCTTIDLGGDLGWVEQVRTVDGGTMLLVRDSRMRFVSPDGDVRWERTASGTPCFFGDLLGTGQDHLLLTRGPVLEVVEAATGKAIWTHRFDPPHVALSVAVGNVLPGRSGLDAAVFQQYGEEGCLIHFPPTGTPEIVWQRTVVTPGEHPERADHRSVVHLDLTVPEAPIIWNVRHHRCRGFNAISGEAVSSLIYEIGGGRRRNYGPSFLATGRDEALICIVAEQVQTHVHAVRLNRAGESTVAWEHYYGEVYVVPGVAVEHIAVADLDGDGNTEIAYNVRDPEQDYRAFFRVRDAATGAVEAEHPDGWCVGHFSDLGSAGASGFLVLSAPDRSTPVTGDLTVLCYTGPGRLEAIATFAQAGTWGPVTWPGQSGNELLIRQSGGEMDTSLVRFRLEDGGLESVARSEPGVLRGSPTRHIISTTGGASAFLVASPGGTLDAVTWEGQRLWQLPLEGGACVLSAADLDGDGRSELAVATPGGSVGVYAFGAPDEVQELRRHEFHGTRSRLGPLLYDLQGDGRLCLIAPVNTPEGELAVRAHLPDGQLLWEARLGITSGGGGRIFAWNAGDFLPEARSAVAISVIDDRRTLEGTFLLDGQTGEIVWFKGIHEDNGRFRPYMPNGIPTAFDYDSDGTEEIGMDLLSYMGFLRGSDGSFACLIPTRNMSQENALYAGLLYNSFCPVYEGPEARMPHWFIPLGHGSFGLLKPDPREGTWREEVGYDVPPRIGMVDVDADGTMEVGYCLINSPTFVCRDLWTGAVKWELELPSPPDSPVIAADVDGDGKGEFLVGRYCIGTDARGKGEIRWESPVSMGWAAIADFDGDGRGEIACAAGGKVYILKGTDGN